MHSHAGNNHKLTCREGIRSHQGVTGVDKEVVAHPHVLKVVDDGRKVAGHQRHGVRVAGHQAPAVQQNVHCLQHVGSMCAVMIRVFLVSFLHAVQKPEKVVGGDNVLHYETKRAGQGHYAG